VLDVHGQLAERFRSLRDSRSGPVFFIEHGLADGEVADLVAEVRRAVAVHPFESGWWDTHRLPLIVSATEVGYRYQGTGTDFWPLLEKELGTHFGPAARQRVREIFAAAAETYRGAQPPQSPWAAAFHLIAWPITHALVPRELHRPLAITLANLRSNVADIDDQALHRAMRVAAASTSARFASLLEDEGLVAAIARSLLGDGGVELSSEATRRIADDLSADRVARRSVAIARRVQRTAPSSRKSRTSSRPSLPPLKGTLRICRRASSLTLEAVFPALDGQLQSQLRRALRRRRYAPRLWGITARVPSEQLLSGLPFALKMSAAPSDDAPLLPGVDDLGIDRNLRAVLDAFTLDVSPPLLFGVSSDGDVGRLVKGPEISGHRSYWLLADGDDAPARSPALGDVGPYTCYALDPEDQAARSALADRGFRVRFGVSVAFAGAPTIDRDAVLPAFAKDDERIVVPRRFPPEGLRVQVDDDKVRVNGDEVLRLRVPVGERQLRVSSGDAAREFGFQGLAEATASPSASCTIESRSEEMSVQALLSGRFALSVESFAPVEGLELSATIEAGGRSAYASTPLGPLPQTTSSNHELFTTLLDDGMRDLLLQLPSVEVRVHVGCLCARSWTLERRVRPCWWLRNPEGQLALTSELGDLPFGAVSLSDPTGPPTTAASVSTDEARLLVPVDLDASEYGGAAPFTTFCVAPKRVRLESPPLRKPRLVRRRRGGGAALGLEELVEAYLRWTLAESDTLIAELRRRQVAQALDTWTAELCCGETWARHEPALQGADPWSLLAELCDESGLGRDSYVELSPDDAREITRLAVVEIRRDQPALWARVGPPSDLGPEEHEALDLAFGRAYEQLAARYEKRGMGGIASEIADGDPGVPPDEWNTALERVASSVELQPIAALLTPTDTAHGLMSLDTSILTLDELAEELHAWAQGARKALAGGAPSRDTLKAIAALWVAPEISVGLDWRGAIDAMIAERAVSRAVRYLTLRSRLVTRGEVI